MLDFKFTVRHDCSPRILDSRALGSCHAYASTPAMVRRDPVTSAELWRIFEYKFACDAYKFNRGRLPGSERTARLRKKRRDAVLTWYRSTLKAKCREALREES